MIYDIIYYKKNNEKRVLNLKKEQVPVKQEQCDR